MICVPDVYHPVRVQVGRLGLIDQQQLFPMPAERIKRGVDRGRPEVPCDNGLDRAFVDPLRIRRIELPIIRILVIAQQEDHSSRLARLQREFDMMRSHRRPAVGMGVERASPLHRRGIFPPPICAQEDVALSVVPGRLLGAGKKSKMVAALTIFRLVIDDAVFDLYLAGVEVALEVCRVVLCIPKAELNAGEDGQASGLSAAVGHSQLPYLQVLAEGNEVERLRLDAIECRTDDAVAQAMPADIVLGIVPCRLPGGRPKPAVLVVAQINVASSGVERNVVVAIARQATEPCVFIEGVSSGGVGDNPEILLATQIVDPGKRRIGPGDNILTILVVKVPVDHVYSL